MIGRGGEEHVGELARRCAAADGRYQRALGAFGVAHLDEVPEPDSSRPARSPARERVEREAAARPSGVGRRRPDPGRARRASSSREPRRQVHEAGERRQAAEPASAATRDAEVEADAERSTRLGSASSSASVALASTSGMSRSSPSRSRLR